MVKSGEGEALCNLLFRSQSVSDYLLADFEFCQCLCIVLPLMWVLCLEVCIYFLKWKATEFGAGTVLSLS